MKESVTFWWQSGSRYVRIRVSVRIGVGKGTLCHTPTGCRRGAHLPFQGHEPVGGNTTIVCDAWPVRRQTYGYLPSRKASPPIGWYQIILLSDRGTCVC